MVVAKVITEGLNYLQHYGLIPQEMIDAGVQVTNWDGGGDLRIFLLYKLFSLLPIGSMASMNTNAA